MKNFENHNDDTIDIFRIFEVLWNNKKTIFYFLSICLIITLAQIFFTKNSYHSKIFITPNNLPPFASKNIAFNDLKNLFFNEKIFDSWKYQNSKSILKFDHFNRTEVIDGFLISKNKKELLVNLEKYEYFKITTNNIQMLSEIHTYLLYVSLKLKEQYLNRANDEIKKINNIIVRTNLSGDSSATISKTLSLSRFVDIGEFGGSLFEFDYPLKPIKGTLNHTTIGIIIFIIGFILSLFFIFIRHTYIIYKSSEKNIQ